MALFDEVLPTDALGVTDNTKVELDNIVVGVSDSVAVFGSVARQITVGSGAADVVAVTDAVTANLVESLSPTNVRAQTSARIRVDFSNNVVPSAALSDPSTYLVNAVSPGAALVVPQQVFLPVGQAFPLFVEIEVTEMTDEAIYQLNLAAGLVSVDGEPSGPIIPAFFAGIGDSPDVFLVLALDKNTCQVQFTEPMLDNAALRDTSNYIFDGGLAVTAVSAAEGSIVTLKTSDQVEGQIYNLTVRGLLAARQIDQVTAVDSAEAVLNVVSGKPSDFVAVVDSVAIEVTTNFYRLVLPQDDLPVVDSVAAEIQKQFDVFISDSLAVVEEVPTPEFELGVVDLVSVAEVLAPEAEYARGATDSVAATDSATPELTSPASTPDVILAGNQLAWHRWDLGITSGFPPPLVDQADDQFTANNLDITPPFGKEPDLVGGGGLNGNGYFHFEKSDEENLRALGTGIMPANMQPHVFFVFRFHVIPTLADEMFSIGQGNLFAPNNHVMSLRADAAAWSMVIRTADGFFFLQPSSSYDTNWHLLEYWYDGADLNLRIDGGSTASVSATGQLNVNFQSMYGMACHSSNGGSNTPNIDVGEMISTQQVISGATRSAVISYLNSYWAGGWS